jgi:predicted 2-oxoglutarate/Fe(II)-dependent dioxygenase YbiX
MPEGRGSVFAARAMEDAACARLREAMTAGTVEPAEVLGDGIIAAADIRRAVHVEVTPDALDLVEQCLDQQRQAIADFFDQPPLVREGVSLLRYQAGDFYRPHVDRAHLESWPAAARREVTVVLFLDSTREVDPGGGFSGGLLRLYPDGLDSPPIDIPARRGWLVAFPSAVFHEVTPVLDGQRDTAVDWLGHEAHDEVHEGQEDQGG